MFFAKHVLGTLLLALSILRSVSTSSDYVGGSSDTIVASTCSDGRPKLCEGMLVNAFDRLERECNKPGGKFRVKYCCETCDFLKPITTAKMETTATTQKSVTEVNSVTTEVATTTTDVVTEKRVTEKRVTTDEVVANLSTTQYLMYTLYQSQTIYSYTLDVDRDPVKNGQFTIPFSTDFPSLHISLFVVLRL